MSSRGDSFFAAIKKKSDNHDKLKTYQCYYQNVRGLRTKTTVFKNNMMQWSYDIIGLTETFLTSSVTNGELFPPGYVVFRDDRAYEAG